MAIERKLSKFENGDGSMPTAQITISIGVASFENDDSPLTGNEQSTIMEQADKALYHAKQTGRNKVIAYHDELATPPQESDSTSHLSIRRK